MQKDYVHIKLFGGGGGGQAPAEVLGGSAPPSGSYSTIHVSINEHVIS